MCVFTICINKLGCFIRREFTLFNFKYDDLFALSSPFASWIFDTIIRFFGSALIAFQSTSKTCLNENKQIIDFFRNETTVLNVIDVIVFFDCIFSLT